jgi:hypothetical protein
MNTSSEIQPNCVMQAVPPPPLGSAEYGHAKPDRRIWQQKMFLRFLQQGHNEPIDCSEIFLHILPMLQPSKTAAVNCSGFNSKCAMFATLVTLTFSSLRL